MFLTEHPLCRRRQLLPLFKSNLLVSLQSYADGSQYMASHDSLSPPYSNSRLTGRFISNPPPLVFPPPASGRPLCFGCLCLWVECRRLAAWGNASRRLLVYPWCSLPLALCDVAPVVSKWPLTQIICLSLTHSHTQHHWNMQIWTQHRA